jgi:hypothetical protein
MVKAAGITAGTLFIAIGLAAQLGGANLFGTPQSVRTVSQAHTPPSPPVRASASAQPSASPSPISLAVTANGTIFNFSNFGGGNGAGHKKKKG